MNLEKFLDLIISESLFFCRVDKLSDKAEGTVPQKNVEEMYAETERWDIKPTKSFIDKYVTDGVKHIASYTQFTLVNCWSRNNDESFALWKVYLEGNKYGVAIQTTYQRLKDCLEKSDFEILIGNVEYGDKSPSLTQSKLFLLKSKYYEYENETRALIFNRYQKKGKELLPIDEKGVKIKIDLNELIEKIYISPLAPEWFYRLVSDLIAEPLARYFQKVNAIQRSRIKQAL